MVVVIPFGHQCVLIERQNCIENMRILHAHSARILFKFVEFLKSSVVSEKANSYTVQYSTVQLHDCKQKLNRKVSNIAMRSIKNL